MGGGAIIPMGGGATPPIEKGRLVGPLLISEPTASDLSTELAEGGLIMGGGGTMLAMGGGAPIEFRP